MQRFCVQRDEEDDYPQPVVVKDPEYAHVKKKPEREAAQERPPVGNFRQEKKTRI